MEIDELLTEFVQNAGLLEIALSILPESTRGALLAAVGIKLQERFLRNGSKDDLDRAISMEEQAVASTPDDRPDRAGRLNNLGDALHSRFERTGSMDDLNRAIMTNEQAVASTPNDHPDRAGRLNSLGNAYESRFERTGSMDDLDRAITTKEQAVASTLDNHPNRQVTLNNSGVTLQSRFERIGSIDDLDRAITMKEQAVASTPDDHPNRQVMLNNLGVILQSRFERIGSIDDLDRAIAMNIASTPDGHPNHQVMLKNLGSALQTRFERTGSMDDLNRAITTQEQAVVFTPDDHHDRGMYLNNLGSVLLCRYERTGSMNDLDRAITTNKQAVASTPDNHPDRAGRLNNLGNAYQSRFERMGSMDDLDRVVLTNEQAVKSTPDDHPDHAIYLNNFGSALQIRFERTGSMGDLDQVITTKEQAVESTRNDHPNRAGRLSNLGAALQSRFERTGSIDDLDRAITTNEQAVASTPDNHPDRAGRLNNLGNAYQSRFERTGSMDDLDRTITTKEQAAASTPYNHPDCAGWLNDLGNAYESRFKRTGSMDDLDRAIATKEQAVATAVAIPSIRLKAAQSCSDLLIKQGVYDRAKRILQTAVRLLPTISPRALKNSDRQYNISQFANITSRAVSLSLLDGEDPYRSLQLLELGRGILANLQLEVRSDISVLATSHPDLAREFQELQYRIDLPSAHTDSPVSFGSSSSESSISDFERRPSESELHHLAEDGPIIVFNISDIRSDAFLITPDEIRTLHLPLLTSESLEYHTKRFLSAINDSQNLDLYRHSIRTLNAVLRWLWDVAVRPILDELGFTQTPSDGEAWPRVWWVGSGLLNILPIHASGYHDSIPPQTALDRVISSYAPTVKSLSYARERTRADQVNVKEKAILISMPKTPEKGSLPFVEIEVENLRKLFSDASISTTIMHNPTRTNVLSELPKHSIVHFACHAYPANDPSQSSLLLEDWKNVPLTVSDLASLNIKSAKFAYLSACHTSSMQDFNLLDESITLSSTIQLSGYSSVVGSLWQVIDSHSAEVARRIYTWILDGDGGFDGQRTAEGLHKAVSILRDRTRVKMQNTMMNDPLVWASYIHVGI